MALDNNHITKLGELKQLIDGLWGKVTTAISNAVSGLLSKSEADAAYQAKGSYATTSQLNSLGNSLSGSIGSINAKIPSNASETNKLATASDIPTVPTNVSAFENDAGYITEAEVPEYELTADKIAAVGELGNTTAAAKRASTIDDNGVFLNSVPSGNASFMASSDGYQSKSHKLEAFVTNGNSGTCGGLRYDNSDIIAIDADGKASFDGNASTATNATNARILNTQTIASSSTAVYGAYVGNLISNSSSSFSEATLFVEISISAEYMSMQYMLHIERRDSEEFSASLVEIGNRQYGFPNNVSCKIAYKRESDYSSSGNGLSKWYIILIDNNGNNITKNYVRISFARIFINNALFEPKFEFLTSVPSTNSYYQARFAPQTYITANKGSSTNPVFIAESGLVTACNFKIVIGSTGTDSSTLYFY